MKYVYLVYEDWHGLIGICATPEKATEMVKKDAFESGLPEDTPLDYDDEDSWGLGRCDLVEAKRGHSVTSFSFAGARPTVARRFCAKCTTFAFFQPKIWLFCTKLFSQKLLTNRALCGII